MRTLKVTKEDKEKDFSCELPMIVYKIKALGTLIQNFDCEFDSSLAPLTQDDLRGISAILLDIGRELQVVNNGLYGKE